MKSKTRGVGVRVDIIHGADGAPLIVRLECDIAETGLDAERLDRASRDPRVMFSMLLRGIDGMTDEDLRYLGAPWVSK